MKAYYKCRHCSYTTKSRVMIRAHVKKAHSCKGGRKTREEFAEDAKNFRGEAKWKREGISSDYEKILGK